MKLLKLFLSAAVLFLFFAFKAVEIKEEKIKLRKGDEKVFQLDFAADTKIQVADKSIVDYLFIPQRKEISLKGVNSGSSSVIIRDLKGEPKIKIFVEVSN